MKDAIISTYYRLLDNVPTRHHRYLYGALGGRSRLTGIVGARGTGKTTLMLQYIKEQINDVDEALYFSADHIYFSSTTVFELIRDQYEVEGRTRFFIDEVHKYPTWQQELKNIYDSFPNLHIVFSGSSSISIAAGSHDLSRRALLHQLEGLSFREFLLFDKGLALPTYSFADLTDAHRDIARKLANITGLRGLFREYLECGFYPFYFEDKASYAQRLLTVVEKAVYEDIASYYNLNTANLPVLKRLLMFYATSQPGELSVNSLSKALRIDNKTVVSYLQMLEAAELIQRVEVDQGGGPLLRKVDKVYLANPNLYHALCTQAGRDFRIGTLRESFVLAMLRASGSSVFYSTSGDFVCDAVTLEIGGKNKGKRQIRDLETPAYLVKDDVLISDQKSAIPIYLFGFLY
ncbi:MAG: ATP-binding protein [Myxococcota bacterium]|nr:ATP-binding protein [Myxococcota bacterium]